MDQSLQYHTKKSVHTSVQVAKSGSKEIDIMMAASFFSELHFPTMLLIPNVLHISSFA